MRFEVPGPWHPDAGAVAGPARTRPPEADPLQRAMRVLRSTGSVGAEASIVDLVLLACDVTDDATEVENVVDGLIATGAAHVLPADGDPMLARRDAAA